MRSLSHPGPLWRAFRLLGVSRWRLMWTVLAGAASLLAAVGLTAVSAWLIARASQMPPILDLTVAFVAVRALGISRGMLRYLHRLLGHDLALVGMVTLRERLYRTLAEGPSEVLLDLRRGDLLARIGMDVDAVGDALVRGVIPVAVAALVSAGSVVLVSAVLPGAGVLLALGLLLAGGVAPLLSASASARAERARVEAMGSVSALAVELVEDAAELMVSGTSEGHFRALEQEERTITGATEGAAVIAGYAVALSTLATGAVVVGAGLLGMQALAAGLSPVLLGVLVLTPLAAFEATSLVPTAMAQLFRSHASATRIFCLLDASPPTVETPARSVRTSASQSAQLTARGLSCGWEAGPAVVSGIDLVLRPGRTLAVVGPSGCGKTTLLLTLAGVLPPRAGTLSRAGFIGTAGPSTPPVVFTPEDAHVFDTTLLENLRVARAGVSEGDATDALQRAGLGGWLAALPEGLQTRTGPSGACLSGGERRRLLLARALLTRAPVLLLDEPAEHLDGETADALFRDLVTRARSERALVVVTHRLSALDVVDEVILLGAGTGGSAAKVLARGTHAQLLASNPTYAWAWRQEQGDAVEAQRWSA